MRGLFDFSSWPGVLSTLLGFTMITLVAVGIRLLIMQTIQQRRERENRQINERLRTLIAAYKVLGGSFTGDLLVDPTHKRQLRAAIDAGGTPGSAAADNADTPGAERRRRIRDAVEAALSDVILLGTEEQVRFAAKAAADLTEGRPAATDELVVSLRNFIRQVLDLDAIPGDVSIPRQGASRPSSGGGRGGGGGERDRELGGGGGRGGAGGAGGGGGGAAAGGAGMGMAVGAGASGTDAPPGEDARG
jgi:heme exporter protein D